MIKEIDKKVHYKNLLMDESYITKSKHDDKREFRAVITTNSLDRDFEVLLPEGGNVKDFKKNGIVLFNHNRDLPIGESLNLRSLKETDTKPARIETLFRIASEGVSDEADKVFRLVKDGILKGISIGFQVLEMRAPTSQDIKKFGKEVRNIISKWKLLEFSIVSVGSNQDALITGLKELDLDPKEFLGDYYEEPIDNVEEIDTVDTEEIEKEIEEVEVKEDIKIEEHIKEKIIEKVKEKRIDMDLVLKYFVEEIKNIKEDMKKNSGRLFD